jgi:cardiolipin synthase
MTHWAIVLLVLTWPVYVVVLSVWVIMQRREPVATLGWIMALLFLPYIGFLIYYFLGPQRIKRSADRRNESHEAVGARGKTKAAKDASELGCMVLAMTGFPPSTASRVDLLIDGGATYDALVKAIESAQHHVHVEYYIYAGDRTGTRIRDALIERAKAGVKVRMLLDGVGSKLTRKFVSPLHAAGVELAFFHPVQWWMLPFARPKLNMRSHRKIVICDGRIGFTGGINVTDDENETINPNAFHDLHLRVEGEAVRWLQVAWLEDWHYATTKEVTDEGLYPEPSPGPISAQVIPSGPDNDWEPIHRTQVDAIHRAERRVWLATPYFVPDRAALFALEGAAMSGLDVRIIIPKRSDSRLVTAAARSYFDTLFKAGVRVYEYGPRMLHSKVLLVDDELAIVGTSNFDTRSFSLNFEIVMMFCDKDINQKLDATLEADMDAAKEVTANSHKPTFLSRFSEDVARLFSSIL